MLLSQNTWPIIGEVHDIMHILYGLASGDLTLQGFPVTEGQIFWSPEKTCNICYITFLNKSKRFKNVFISLTTVFFKHVHILQINVFYEESIDAC